VFHRSSAGLLSAAALARACVGRDGISWRAFVPDDLLVTPLGEGRERACAMSAFLLQVRACGAGSRNGDALAELAPRAGTAEGVHADALMIFANSLSDGDCARAHDSRPGS
jgi:hypothetical protein